MSIVHSLVYNGIIVALNASIAIFLIGCLVVFWNQIHKSIRSLWMFSIFLLLANAIIKSLFYGIIHWDITDLWWISPIYDSMVIVFFVWTLITLWRLRVNK